MNEVYFYTIGAYFGFDWKVSPKMLTIKSSRRSSRFRIVKNVIFTAKLSEPIQSTIRQASIQKRTPSESMEGHINMPSRMMDKICIQRH